MWERSSLALEKWRSQQKTSGLRPIRSRRAWDHRRQQLRIVLQNARDMTEFDQSKRCYYCWQVNRGCDQQNGGSCSVCDVYRAGGKSKNHECAPLMTETEFLQVPSDKLESQKTIENAAPVCRHCGTKSHFENCDNAIPVCNVCSKLGRLCSKERKPRLESYEETACYTCWFRNFQKREQNKITCVTVEEGAEGCCQNCIEYAKQPDSNFKLKKHGKCVLRYDTGDQIPGGQSLTRAGME